MSEQNSSVDSTYIKAIGGSLWSKKTNILIAAVFAGIFVAIGYIIAISNAAPLGAGLKSPVSSAFTDKCLDNSANKQQVGNKVQLWTCNGTDAQQWRLYDNGTLHLNDSAYCLDIKDSSKVSNALAQLNSCNGSASQTWKATDDHTVVNQNSGLCLDDMHSQTPNGNTIWQFKCNGTNAQKWYFSTTLSSVGDKCLDNDANKVQKGNKVQLWACNGTSAQQWTFKDGGSIHIKNSDLCLSTQGGKTVQSATAQIDTCDNTVSQNWHYNTDNKTIVNVSSGLCLDDKGAIETNGNTIWLYKCNGTNAQKWNIPTSGSVSPPVITTPTPTPPTPPAPTPPTPTPPTPTPPTPTPTTSEPLPGYNKLIFSDEFNGTTLDTNKWQTCNASFIYGGNVKEAGDQYCKTHYNNEKQLFRMSTSPNTNNPNIKVNGGSLHLIGTKENGQYYSGMISTGPNRGNYNLPGFNAFGYTYGYFEGRAKFPKGNGFWPSFWMLPVDQQAKGGWPYSGEYDIVEVLGGSPAYGGSGTNKIFQTRFDEETGGGGDDSNYIVADTSTDFHTYGFEWGPGFLKWYFDGRLYKQVYSSHIKNYPFYITANFSMCGSFSGDCDNSTPFPSEFTVDYMRVYQK